MESDYYKTLVHNNDLLVYLLDRDYCLLALNDRFKFWFNAVYGVEPYAGMNILFQTEGKWAEESKKWRTRYDSVINSAKKRNYIEAFYANGKQYNVSVSMHPIIENGMVQQIAIFAKNINIEIEEERKAYPLGNEFKQLVEQSDVAFWIWNTERILYVNSAYETITQHPRSEFYRNPETALRLVHPDDIARLLDSMSSFNYTNDLVVKEEFRIVQTQRKFPMDYGTDFPNEFRQREEKDFGNGRGHYRNQAEGNGSGSSFCKVGGHSRKHHRYGFRFGQRVQILRIQPKAQRVHQRNVWRRG